jgi:hypothetical protein
MSGFMRHVGRRLAWYPAAFLAIVSLRFFERLSLFEQGIAVLVILASLATSFVVRWWWIRRLDGTLSAKG